MLGSALLRSNNRPTRVKRLLPTSSTTAYSCMSFFCISPKRFGGMGILEEDLIALEACGSGRWLGRLTSVHNDLSRPPRSASHNSIQKISTDAHYLQWNPSGRRTGDRRQRDASG